MPKAVRHAVVTKINFTRKGPGGRKWQPSKDAVICNVHYLDCQGPSKGNVNVIPAYFKRPSYPTLPPPPSKRRRLQQQAALVAMEPSSCGVQTSLDTVYTCDEDTIIENQSSIRTRGEDALHTSNPIAESLDSLDVQDPEATSTGEQEISHIEDAGNQDTFNSLHTERTDACHILRTHHVQEYRIHHAMKACRALTLM